MTENQVKAEMLINIIESLDEEHGTSLIDFDIAIPEDADSTNEYIINNQEAADACLEYLESYVSDLAGSGNCYWSADYFNQVINSYPTELQRYAKEIIRDKDEAVEQKTIHSQYNIIKRVSDDSILFIYPDGADWEDIPVFDDDVYTTGVTYYKEDFKF